MKGQIILAGIFFLILATFKNPPPQLEQKNSGYFTQKDFQVAIPALPFVDAKNEGKKEKKLEIDLLQAKSVYISDITYNKILYQNDSGEARPLASLTKLMTALLLEEKADPEAQIAISSKAVRQEDDQGLHVGDKFNKEDLENFILVASSNDGAWAAAEFLTQGNEADFPEMMNARARELGLESLYFQNPHGLDVITASSKIAGAFGSAADIGNLFKYIYQNYPSVLEDTRKPEISITSSSGRKIFVKNTNKALDDIPNIIGGKTGYTDIAGGNLVFMFKTAGDHTILVSILGSTEEGRFSDAKKIVSAVTNFYKENKTQ